MLAKIQKYKKRNNRKIKQFNIYLDEESNNVRGKVQKISKENSEVLCYVIPTDEEVMIARDTYELIN